MIKGLKDLSVQQIQKRVDNLVKFRKECEGKKGANEFAPVIAAMLRMYRRRIKILTKLKGSLKCQVKRTTPGKH